MSADLIWIKTGVKLRYQVGGVEAQPERGVAHEASLDEFIRDANLKLVRSRLADTFDPSHRQTLLDLIEALESGEAIPAKALEAGLRPR